MKTIQSLALLGAALIAACSERPSATAPAPDVAGLARASSLGDRPYTWSFTCKGQHEIGARWWWTANGVQLTEETDAICYPNHPEYNKNTSGTGVRPATADGFYAQVGGSAKQWAFDPAQAFSAELQATESFIVDCKQHHDFFHTTCKLELTTGALNVDS